MDEQLQCSSILDLFPSLSTTRLLNSDADKSFIASRSFVSNEQTDSGSSSVLSDSHRDLTVTASGLDRLQLINVNAVNEKCVCSLDDVLSAAGVCTLRRRISLPLYNSERAVFLPIRLQFIIIIRSN